MSWLSIPLPNPFKALQFTDDDEEAIPSDSNQPQLDDNAAAVGAGGVKDDLSVISETIGRQLRGVAAFLAPPSQPSQSAAHDDDNGDVGGDSADSSSPTFAGIKSDLAEIGGSFKSSLSLLSANKAVSELSRFASNFLQLNDDNEGDDGGGGEEEGVAVVGITDEVVEFVKETSLRSECWSDFPLELNDEFNMSPMQSEHALVIEQLVPNLAALRDRLSADMSDQQFWMIYFILLLPRLDEDDFELLSTPEIVEARNTLLLMLKNKRNNTGESQTDTSFQSVLSKEAMERNSSEEKLVLALSSEASRGTETETIERWSEEEDANSGSIHAQNQLKNEDDVSFSDLEDDDGDFLNRQPCSGPVQFAVASSRDGPSEWVRLNKNVETGGDRQGEGQIKSRDRDSEDDETNDWLAIDDFDPASMAAA
ncbi:hypothetical protein Ancab_035154 [Ancistrocladus abbreviatus]